MWEGNEMAWRVFFDAYVDRLCRYLLVVTAGNEEVTREVLQATLIRLARHIKPFGQEEVFWSWLTVVARSAFADETRKRRRYLSLLDRFTRQASGRAEETAEPQAQERLETLLEEQLQALPPEEQELIEQKYFAGHSVRQLAQDLGTTEKAIESKLSRIRRRLKEAVLAQLNDESQS